jgi:protoporphyrinogen oxidase
VTVDGGAALDVAQVWSTAPLPALGTMTDPAPPAPATAAAARLRHRGLVLLYLVLDRPQWTAFDAHYFPGPEVLAARVSEPRNYRDDPSQPADRTVLCAEIACWPGDEIWSASDADLADRLAAELAATGLPEPRWVGVESRRLPHVYPVYPPGYLDDLGALETWAGDLGGLITFGRQGLFTPDNTHHALAMGWAAADALGADGALDAGRWRVARDGFRSFVVED